MKRLPFLLNLSKEHHQALVVAMKLQRGQWRDLDWDAVMASLESHFVEEEVLFTPLWQSHTQTLQLRFEQEHAQLRRYMQQRPEHLDEDTSHSFGRLLHDHVRFEERELFPALEAIWQATEQTE